MALTNKRICITGGAGFIGSHLVDRLVALGRSVRVIDDLSTGSRERLRAHSAQVELIEADLAVAELGSLVAGAERVFHLAAVPSVPRSVRDPLTTHQGTLTATLRLLIAARDEKVARFVFSSSSSVYGETAVSPKHEGLPVAPISPYGIAKAAAEAYTRVFGALYGLRTVSLRYFNVFGPSQDPASQYAAVVPIFVRRALAGEPLPISGDGTQTRDFTYVDNVIDANLSAATCDVAPGAVYNVAAGSPHSVLELARSVARLAGREAQLVHGPPRPGDIRHSHADISRAAAELEWTPRVSFEEGLRRTVEWYRGR
jgi:nucleoside-diphosphate-sugar epimerase